MNEIIQTYCHFIKQLCPKLSDEALDYLAKGLTVTELKPKYFYIQANTTQQAIGYIHSGLLRAFYIDDNGNEKTVNFFREQHHVAHYTSVNNPTPSKFYFQTIEQSVIINIPYAHIQDCCDRFPLFERYIRILVEEAHSNLLNRMEGFLFENAETVTCISLKKIPICTIGFRFLIYALISVLNGNRSPVSGRSWHINDL